MSNLAHHNAHRIAANGRASDAPNYSRIRVSPTTAAAFRAFLEQQGAAIDEALPALIEFYKSQTEYRHSAETGHLLAELRKFDASILALAQTNLLLMELARSNQQADLLRLAGQIETSVTKD